MSAGGICRSRPSGMSDWPLALSSSISLRGMTASLPPCWRSVIDVAVSAVRMPVSDRAVELADGVAEVVVVDRPVGLNDVGQKLLELLRAAVADIRGDVDADAGDAVAGRAVLLEDGLPCWRRRPSFAAPADSRPEPSRGRRAWRRRRAFRPAP